MGRSVVTACSVLLALALGGVAAAEDAGQICLWHECEQIIAAPGWGTTNWWRPSGGLFTFPAPNAAPAEVELDLPRDALWAVWLRARDETLAMRLVTATVNGEPSYVMGGTDTGHWVWYLVGTVQAERLELQFREVPSHPNMGPWLDALLVTDDLSFVPPPDTPADGYASHQTSDADRQRPAWIWYPGDAGIGSVAFYRTTFEVPEGGATATLDLRAIAHCDVYVNETLVTSVAYGEECAELDVSSACRPGPNVLGIFATHAGWLPGITAHLQLGSGDAVRHVATNPAWRASEEEAIDWLEADFDASGWAHPYARIGERSAVGHWAWEPPT